MFNNWINLFEPVYFLQKMRRDSDFLRRVKSKIVKNKISRVKNCWSDVTRPGNWYDILERVERERALANAALRRSIDQLRINFPDEPPQRLRAIATQMYGAEFRTEIERAIPLAAAS